MTDKLNEDALALLDVDTEIQRVDVQAVATLNRSEIECQVDVARKYPRSIKAFLNSATTLATLTQEIAESCIYTLPRAGKSITGPSVRFAEVLASCFGNLHTGTRVLGADEKEVIAQGVVWDFEKNNRVTVESRRRITKKDGKRYDDDMINVTGAAAASIARRNAIFQVIPRAYVDSIFAEVKRCAVGTAATIESRRESAFAKFAKMGVTADRILAKLEKASIVEVGLDELETLIGVFTSIRDGASIEEHFPVANGTPSSDAKALDAKLREPKKAATAAPAAAAQAVPVPVAKAEPTKTEPKAEPPKTHLTDVTKSATPAPANTQAVDWSTEIDTIRTTIQEGLESKSASREQIKIYMLRTIASAPPDVRDQVIRFWNMMAGDTVKP